MAYTLSVLTRGGLDELEGYDTIEAAIADTRRMWMEDDGAPEHFTLQDEDGRVVATLTRPAHDPEVCITVVFGEGGPTVERHRCRYLHDAAGRYLGPEVTALAAELVDQN